MSYTYGGRASWFPVDPTRVIHGKGWEPDELHFGPREVLIQTNTLSARQTAQAGLARRRLLHQGSTVWSDDETPPRRAR